MAFRTKNNGPEKGMNLFDANDSLLRVKYDVTEKMIKRVLRLSLI